MFRLKVYITVPSFPNIAFWDRVSHFDLELADLARLTSQSAPGICLSLPEHMSPFLAFPHRLSLPKHMPPFLAPPPPRFWEPNSGFYTCPTRTSPAKLSPYALIVIFFLGVFKTFSLAKHSDSHLGDWGRRTSEFWSPWDHFSEHKTKSLYLWLNSLTTMVLGVAYLVLYSS